MNVKTLERCFNERKKSNIVDMVEVGVQNEILIAIDSIVNLKIELAIRLLNASVGRDVTSVTAISKRGEHVGITAPFKNVSKTNNTLHVLSTNDETRIIIPDEVIEFSVPGTHFSLQPHTHHSSIYHRNSQLNFVSE